MSFDGDHKPKTKRRLGWIMEWDAVFQRLKIALELSKAGDRDLLQTGKVVGERALSHSFAMHLQTVFLQCLLTPNSILWLQAGGFRNTVCLRELTVRSWVVK